MDSSRHLSTPVVLTAGIFGGAVLGIAARAWMRLIATDPEFTWNGTMFIVLGFTVFGFTQAITIATRRATTRRAPVTFARVVGFVGTLPLFVAAGGVMFPTVIGGSLAVYRTDWSKWARVICAVVALVPIGLVTSGVADDWGWSWRTGAGLVGLVAVYAVVVAAERPTLSPQTDGWRLRRGVRAMITVAATAAFLIPAAGAGLR
jgi:hypothetical protein